MRPGLTAICMRLYLRNSYGMPMDEMRYSVQEVCVCVYGCEAIFDPKWGT